MIIMFQCICVCVCDIYIKSCTATLFYVISSYEYVKFLWRQLFFQMASWLYSPVSPVSPMIDPATIRGITASLENENQDTPPVIADSRNLTSSFKKTSCGTKLIRIEIYEAEQFDSLEKSICKCTARVCAQHVVQDVHTDNILYRVKDLIKCIDNNLYTAL